jgi:formylglycine-generating enzyme required for sulfatase activity
MGSPATEKGRQNDEDQVEVTLTQGFWLGKHEVTQREWKEVVGSEPWNGKQHVEAGDGIPATFISWDDAQAFCKKLSERERSAARLPEGWGYALPTEAQWEYACRAGTTTRYYFGDDETQLSNFGWWGGLSGNGNAKFDPFAHQVGEKQPNAWGLCDTHGNVWEWCQDIYVDKRPGGRDPLVAAGSQSRVYKSGAWSDDQKYCRSAFRGLSSPTLRNFRLGFRMALVPNLPQK